MVAAPSRTAQRRPWRRLALWALLLGACLALAAFAWRWAENAAIDALIEEKMSLAHDLITGDGGAEKLLTDMGAEELLSFVALDVNSAVV